MPVGTLPTTLPFHDRFVGYVPRLDEQGVVNELRACYVLATYVMSPFCDYTTYQNLVLVNRIVIVPGSK